MKNWEERLDEFLAFTKRHPILKNSNNISHEKAEQLAHKRFDLFDEKRHKMETSVAEEEYLRELEVLEKDISKK